MMTIGRRAALGVLAVSALSAPSLGASPFPSPVSYTTFGGETVRLRPFVGRHIALLLDPARGDRVGIARSVEAIDAGYRAYAKIVGGKPAPYREHQGRLSIAEVAATCGAGCGYLGYTGIELTPSVVDWLIRQASAYDRYDQAVFYELGRNFWLFDQTLGRLDAFVNGFAIANRFNAMADAKLAGAPFNGTLDFETFRRSILIDLLDLYLADRTLNWKSTILANKAPPNPYDWSASDLAASFFHKIRRDHGKAAYHGFWRALATLPPAQDAAESAARFVQAARIATGKDYRPLLRDPTLPLRVNAPGGP